MFLRAVGKTEKLWFMRVILNLLNEKPILVAFRGLNLEQVNFIFKVQYNLTARQNKTNGASEHQFEKLVMSK